MTITEGLLKGRKRTLAETAMTAEEKEGGGGGGDTLPPSQPPAYDYARYLIGNIYLVEHPNGAI